MTTYNKNKFKFSLIAFAILLNIISISALSCAPPINNPGLFALCNEGNCSDGFSIEHEYTGNFCDTIEVVKDKDLNFENIPLVAAKNNQDLSDGIYNLRAGSLEKVSDIATIEELEKIKSEWETKEDRSRQEILLSQLFEIVMIAAQVGLIIFWPLIIIKLKPDLKKNSEKIIILAIIFQAFAIFSGIFTLAPPWSYPLVRTAHAIVVQVLIFSIIVEIGYLIYKKLKTKKIDQKSAS